MRQVTFAIVFAMLVAVGAVTPGTAARVARPAFNGKVCSLLTAKQVATVHVSPLKCTDEKPMRASTLSAFSGYWGSPRVGAANLDIEINLYKDVALFQVSMKGLRGQAKYYGSPQTVGGVGSAAYEGKSGPRGAILFVVGRYIVTITVRSGGTLKSFAPLNALAKAVASAL